MQHEGLWETGHVMSERFLQEIKDVFKDAECERDKSMVMALRDATIAATAQVGGLRNVRAMDAWSATFVRV